MVFCLNLTYYTLQKKTIEYSLLQSLYALNAIEQIEKQVKMTHKPEFLLNRYCCFGIFVFSLVQLGWTGKVNMVFNRLKIGAKYYIVGGLLLVFLISLFSLNFHLWECGCCWNRLPGEKKNYKTLNGTLGNQFLKNYALSSLLEWLLLSWSEQHFLQAKMTLPVCKVGVFDSFWQWVKVFLWLPYIS